jgi:hypothetical protein
MRSNDDLRLPEGGFDGRCELMLGVTCDTLRSDPELRLCEGLRLIEATHRAVARLSPDALDVFERQVLPQLRSILMNRFGVAELPSGGFN